MTECRLHASEAGAAIKLVISEAMFMSILISHQKTQDQIRAELERIKAFQGVKPL